MEENKNKEDFCPVCVASVPLAFSLTVDGNDDEYDEKITIKNKKKHSWQKWISLMLIIIGIIVTIIIFTC